MNCVLYLCKNVTMQARVWKIYCMLSRIAAPFKGDNGLYWTKTDWIYSPAIGSTLWESIHFETNMNLVQQSVACFMHFGKVGFSPVL
jgi:hypothetical protein